MKFSLLFIFFFLLVLTSTISAQPSQTNVNIDVGLDVEFEKLNVLEQNIDHNFKFHVYNRSDGLRLNKTDVTCFLDIIQKNGSHIINEGNLNLQGGNNDFNLLVKGANFSIMGFYSIVPSCNSTSFGGFNSYPLVVTADGKPFEAFPNQFAVILFAAILIMFGLLNERYTMAKRMGAFILMVMGVLTLFPGYNFINHTTLFGLVIGSTIFAMGFWFLIEDSFSRTRQEERFDQDQGEEGEEGLFEEEENRN